MVAGSLDNLQEEHGEHHAVENDSLSGRMQSALWALFRPPRHATTMINTFAIGDKIKELKPELVSIRNGIWIVAACLTFTGSYIAFVISCRLLVRYKFVSRRHFLNYLCESHFGPTQVRHPPPSTLLALPDGTPLGSNTTPWLPLEGPTLQQLSMDRKMMKSASRYGKRKTSPPPTRLRRCTSRRSTRASYATAIPSSTTSTKSTATNATINATTNSTTTTSSTSSPGPSTTLPPSSSEGGGKASSGWWGGGAFPLGPIHGIK